MLRRKNTIILHNKSMVCISVDTFKTRAQIPNYLQNVWFRCKQLHHMFVISITPVFVAIVCSERVIGLAVVCQPITEFIYSCRLITAFILPLNPWNVAQNNKASQNGKNVSSCINFIISQKKTCCHCQHFRKSHEYFTLSFYAMQ